MPETKYEHNPTAQEERVLHEVKQSADKERRDRWLPHEGGGYRDQVGLFGVSRILKTDFVKRVAELSTQFKGQRIEVLFEGSGSSRFPEELAEKCRKIGVKVRVFRSDLYSKQVFQELAGEHGFKPAPYRRAAPEELVRVFGQNRFHLVISRSGGLTYTPLPQVKGILNVCKILKPGGEAHIISEDVETPPLPIGKEIRLKHPGTKKLTSVGEFFSQHPQYQAEETEYLTGTPYLRRHPILRIKKT